MIAGSPFPVFGAVRGEPTVRNEAQESERAAHAADDLLEREDLLLR